MHWSTTNGGVYRGRNPSLLWRHAHHHQAYFFQCGVLWLYRNADTQRKSKNKNTTATVFGNELHRYSIADGIRDGNVLTFDPTKVLTYKDYDLRKVVALKMANAKTEEEAIKDPVKSAKYYEYMDSTRIQMAGHQGKDGKYVKGIEDHIPREQYELEEHRQAVLQDISDHWIHLSHNSKFHGIFATSSIGAIILQITQKEHQTSTSPHYLTRISTMMAVWF